MTGGVVLASVSSTGLVTLVALAVLAVAIVSAFVPGLPTGLVSLLGVGLYWWGTGFTDPGLVVVLALAAVCVLAVLADWFGGVIAANVGGASTTTTLVAGAVGLALLFVAGPLGVLVGSAATVFVIEFAKRRDAGQSAKAAGAYVVGFFASAVAQAFLAFTVFVAMLWIVLV
jgi:hypothetical protein